MTEPTIGEQMYALAERLWPFNRSISGAGLRATLGVLRSYLPELKLIEVASGTRVLDWIVPEEWRIGEAWLEAPDGRRIADIAANNLHVVGYSTAVNRVMTLDELQPHLHSLVDMPEAVPYVTSYYHRNWGFCLSDEVRATLPAGSYRAYIDAEHFAGAITLAELRLPGETEEEIFISTYCCHPSLANNELSGPVLVTFLAQWLARVPRRYSYRIVFVPEMIGSIAYLAANLDDLKSKVIAGFNVSCVGDERAWSFLPSRAGNTLSDRVGRHVLKHIAGSFTEYSWNDRGSDESNYCAPGVDLPIASLMRSKYREYPEYHTSLDRLGSVVTADGLAESLVVYQRAIEAIESDCVPRTLVLGEPQLGRRGLYPPISTRDSTRHVRRLLDVISQCDGKQSMLAIADLSNAPIWEVAPMIAVLVAENLVAIAPGPP